MDGNVLDGLRTRSERGNQSVLHSRAIHAMPATARANDVAILLPEQLANDTSWDANRVGS